MHPAAVAPGVRPKVHHPLLACACAKNNVYVGDVVCVYVLLPMCSTMLFGGVHTCVHSVSLRGIAAATVVELPPLCLCAETTITRIVA